MDNNNYKEILKYAMNMELKAKEFYTLYKDKVVNDSVKKLFAELSEMEDDHYNILKTQLDSVEKDGKFAEVDIELDGGEDIIEEAGKDLDNVNLEYDLADFPILRMAYAMEADFAQFYQTASEKAEDPNAKKLLKVLTKWEINHRDSFEQQLKMAQKETWFENSFSPF